MSASVRKRRTKSVAFGHTAVIQTPELGARIMRYELADHEWTAIKPMLPNKPRAVPRVNDRRVLSTAQTVAIALHEFATNAAKYGSLSAAGGRVKISWSLPADGRLSLRWIESGGPAAAPPTHRGFGTRILESMIGQLKGEVRFDWRNEGLACEIGLPLA